MQSQKLGKSSKLKDEYKMISTKHKSLSKIKTSSNSDINKNIFQEQRKIDELDDPKKNVQLLQKRLFNKLLCCVFYTIIL